MDLSNALFMVLVEAGNFLETASYIYSYRREVRKSTQLVAKRQLYSYRHLEACPLSKIWKCRCSETKIWYRIDIQCNLKIG